MDLEERARDLAEAWYSSAKMNGGGWSALTEHDRDGWRAMAKRVDAAALAERTAVTQLLTPLLAAVDRMRRCENSYEALDIAADSVAKEAEAFAAAIRARGEWIDDKDDLGRTIERCRHCGLTWCCPDCNGGTSPVP